MHVIKEIEFMSSILHFLYVSFVYYNFKFRRNLLIYSKCEMHRITLFHYTIHNLLSLTFLNFVIVISIQRKVLIHYTNAFNRNMSSGKS